MVLYQSNKTGGLMIKLTIPGNPIAKKRPRFARVGKFVRTYNDQETEESRFLHHVENHDIEPINGPVSVMLWFFMPRPKGHYGSGKNAGKLKETAPKYPTTKPDVDNLNKFAFDCLNGVAWVDDAQVVVSKSMKAYAGEQIGEHGPRTEIIISDV